MRILYITTIGSTMGFFNSLIGELKNEGHIVDIATNEIDSKVPDHYREIGCKIYQISTSRSPFSFGNIKAISEIRKIAKDYDIVHCHTPLASMATRLACKKLRKQGLKVIYTSHGFHFYSGAPLINWVLYYPIEKVCSYWTDTLFTINKEDYDLAKRKLNTEDIELIPGVGIDVNRFKNATVDITKKRQEINVPENAFVLISVGELNDNKNHKIIIEALGDLKNKDIYYVIAGKGKNRDKLESLAKEINVNLILLDFREDVEELYKMADVNVFPSIREGFGLAAIEGMAAGLPLICSDNRGTRTYAINKNNAIVCKNDNKNDNKNDFKNAILSLYNNRELCRQFGYNGQLKANKFSTEISNKKVKDKYLELVKTIH